MGVCVAPLKPNELNISSLALLLFLHFQINHKKT